MTAQQRKLVQNGAKGVAGRGLGDPSQAARDGAKFRSSVKRFGGRAAEEPAREEPPQQRARKRTIRAEQAATGMMGPPPGTFDEKAIQDWLTRMSAEDLRKLSRLVAISRQGKDGGTAAWNKVDHGLRQQAMHVEVHGGTVNINTAPAPNSYQPGQRRGQDNWGRHLARIKDFING